MLSGGYIKGARYEREDGSKDIEGSKLGSSYVMCDGYEYVKSEVSSIVEYL